MALPFRHKVVIKSTLRVSILKNNGGEAKPKFQNLMDDDSSHCDMNRPLTDHEKHLLIHKNYEAFVHEQKSYDADLKVKLAQQEEDLRAEEEAFYEAKREAARIAKLQRAKEQQARTRNATTHGVKSWLGDDENDWEVGGGEDDFEMFLASVKARSLSARAWLRHGSGDAPSSNSSQTKEKSQNSSSIDLEWDHEAGDL